MRLSFWRYALSVTASMAPLLGLAHAAPAPAPGPSADARALAAADAYIQGGRRGKARLRIAGAAPGTPVRVRLRRHAFHFGINIPGTFNRYARIWKLTEAGARYETLMAAWSTDVTATVAADGTVAFTGFYGDYAVEAGGKTFSFTLASGTTDYQLR